MASQSSPLHEAVRLCLAVDAAGAAQVMECLRDEDWETAFVLLEKLGDARPQRPEFWSLLAHAARAVWLREDADWYEWRSSEARNGALRAELCLVRTEEGGRVLPVLPGRSLRPMWDVGRRTPEGELELSIASLWVESRYPLQPSERAPVRLIPLTPEHWQHIKPGDVITMYERRPPAGCARVTEVLSPVVDAPW